MHYCNSLIYACRFRKNLISLTNTPREAFSYSGGIEHKKKEIKQNSFANWYWKFYIKSNIVLLIIFFLSLLYIDFDKYEKLFIAP